jgi:hypothetical protein
MLAGIFQPGGQMIERLASGNVVDQQGTGRSSIVGTCNRSERFLAGRIPNLQFDLFAIDRDHAGTEFNADGQVVNGLETFVGELEQQARLADTWKIDKAVLLSRDRYMFFDNRR